MLRVWSVSGAELAFPAGDVTDVQALKNQIRQQWGIPVSIQAFLHSQHRLDLSQKLDAPMELQLVQESFHSTSPNRRLLDLELIEYAATTGNYEVARRLLDAGADKDCRSGCQDGETVLIRSAAAGHVGIVRLLLGRSASVDLSRSDGKTALTCSCQNQFVEVSRLLLQAHASPYKLDSGTKTPLHHAARKGCVETVVLLLQFNAGCVDLSSGWRTSTPLMDACREGHVEAARLLLRADANPGLCDAYGRTALHHAAHGGRSQSSGRTALLYALREGHVKATRLLLQAGACPDVCDASGMTPLHHAALGGCPEMITALLERGARKDFQSQKSGRTALHYALRQGHVEATRLLLQAGANPGLSDAYGMTALHQLAGEVGSAG